MEHPPGYPVTILLSRYASGGERPPVRRQQGREFALRGDENGKGRTVVRDGRREVAGLLDRHLSHPLQATDYDTSWALRLTNRDGHPSYPALTERMLGRQRPDGSWGSQVPHVHDRLLTTLSMVIALALLGDRRSEEARAGGKRYLSEHAGDLGDDADRTIGFELIFPALLEEAAEIGLDLPYDALGRHGKERAAKLALLPQDRLFQTHTTALFSLEAFRRSLDVRGAVGLMLENGSMAGSPSATAYLVSRVPGWREELPRSAAYLDGLISSSNPGLPAVHPCDVFVRAWTLYYLQHGGLFDTNRDLLEPHLNHLQGSISPEGVGFSAAGGFVDSDDTALTLLVLHRAGYEVDGSVLLRFEQDRWFSVHGHETNPSVSANLHILEALPVIPEEHRPRVREKTLAYLLSARREGAYWRDKWHASVFYPTTRALTILADHARGELGPTVDWLLAGQRPDGSWGQYAPTTEETSLVLLALLHHHRTARTLPEEPMRRAAAYLRAHDGTPGGGYPELWIGKALYAPAFAIEACKLSALALYGDTFGTLP